LSVSKSSCYRWRWIFGEFGTVKKPPSPLVGHTRIITRAQHHHQPFEIITQSHTSRPHLKSVSEACFRAR
ncbi:hypothetical protein K503DRAFT_705075, partial [Rhizopogon vinicolor AM-OR11-026]